MSRITVEIAEITGKFARCVVSHLLKNQVVTIKGYCRDPRKLPASLLASKRITITQGQSDDEKALQTFAKDSDVFVCGYLGDCSLKINSQKSLVILYSGNTALTDSPSSPTFRPSATLKETEKVL